MKRYRVIGRVCEVGLSSLVQLDDEQYRRRAPFVEVVDEKKGIYRALKILQFKQGEEFGLDEPVNKRFLETCKEISSPKPASKPKTSRRKPSGGTKLKSKKASTPAKSKAAQK